MKESKRTNLQEYKVIFAHEFRLWEQFFISKSFENAYYQAKKIAEDECIRVKKDVLFSIVGESILHVVECKKAKKTHFRIS